MKQRIKIFPLSVNKAYKGKKTKTPDYRSFEIYANSLMKNFDVPKKGKLQVHYIFGFSSRASDVDNPVKPFQDVLQSKYNFNDSRIYRIIADKEIVKKGEEFIQFEIKLHESDN